MNIPLCYAFKGNRCYELMSDHISGIIECLRSRWEFKGLKEKLKRLLGVDISLIEDLFISTALIHDIGKASMDFQDECFRGECKSFYKHYVISAKFAVTLGVEADILPRNPRYREDLFNKVISGNLDLNNVNKEVLYIALVILPILFHHYAQIDEEVLFKDIDKKFFTMSSPCRTTFINITKSIPCYPQSNLGKNIVNVLVSIIDKDNEIPLLLLPLTKDMALSYEPKFMRVVIESSTGLLNMCDGNVAHKNRKECNDG